MKKSSSLFFALILTSLFTSSGCGSDPNEGYHIEKRYWDAADYHNALSIIQFRNQGPVKLPCYSIPAQTPIFRKLVDVNNFKVIMEDNELGLDFREKYSQEMFDNCRELSQLYQARDNQDKFIYSKELAEIMNFHKEFQISYFKLGNEKIKKEADDPNAPDVIKIVRLNEQTLVDNYTNNLDFIKYEKGFSDEALAIYVAGVDKYFKQLISDFPDSDYTAMLTKATLMQQKAEATIVKSMLTNLIVLLDKNIKSKVANQSAT